MTLASRNGSPEQVQESDIGAVTNSGRTRYELDQRFSMPNIPVQFDYPTAWGEPRISRVRQRTRSISFEVASCFRDDYCGFNIHITPYDAGAMRYEEVCYEGLCEEIDHVIEQEYVASHAASVVAGHSATVRDSYASPGGNLNRQYRLYTEQYAVTINVNAGVFELLVNTHNKQGPLDKIVSREYGEVTDIDDFLRHFEGSRPLQEFFDTSIQLLNSLTVRDSAE